MTWSSRCIFFQKWKKKYKCWLIQSWKWKKNHIKKNTSVGFNWCFDPILFLEMEILSFPKKLQVLDQVHFKKNTTTGSSHFLSPNGQGFCVNSPHFQGNQFLKVVWSKTIRYSQIYKINSPIFNDYCSGYLKY